jgi:hypothetical protein
MSAGERLRGLLDDVVQHDENCWLRGRVPGTEQTVRFTLAGGLNAADMTPELEAFLAQHGLPYTENRAVPPDVEQVLAATYDFLSRFLVMSEDGLRVLALWVFHTWAFEAAETTPYISVRSPERESGKTRVIEVVSLITRRSEQIADVSISALFRSIEKFGSTCLFDEVDGIFRGRDEDSKDLKRLLNSGYRTGVTVLRTVGDQHEPKRFSTFSPKLLAGLGGLPDTLESRCVPITMHRRLPHERAERLRLRVVRPEAEKLAGRLSDVAAGCIPALAGAYPSIPTELGDRAADCAEPLLAIADYAGGTWPTLARKALVALQGGRSIEDESTSTRLLADIRMVFGERDRIATRELLAGLHELEESPWEDWFGKPLTAEEPDLESHHRDHDREHHDAFGARDRRAGPTAARPGEASALSAYRRARSYPRVTSRSGEG